MGGEIKHLFCIIVKHVTFQLTFIFCCVVMDPSSAPFFLLGGPLLLQILDLTVLALNIAGHQPFQKVTSMMMTEKVITLVSWVLGGLLSLVEWEIHKRLNDVNRTALEVNVFLNIYY